MAVEWIEYKGVKILYNDYRNCKTIKEMIENLEKQIELSRNLSEPAYYLANFTGKYVDKEYFEKAKKYGKEFKRITRKGALVGFKKPSLHLLSVGD